MQNSLFKTAASLLQYKGNPAPQLARKIDPNYLVEMSSMCAKYQEAFTTRYERRNGRMRFVESIKVAGGSQRGGIFDESGGGIEISGAEFDGCDGFICPYCNVRHFVYCGTCKRLICYSSVSALQMFTCAAGCTAWGAITTLDIAEARAVGSHAQVKPIGHASVSSRPALGSGRK